MGEIIEMTYETFIPELSTKIHGKTFSELEEEFGIRIEHYHEGSIIPDTRRDPTSDTEIHPGMSIKVVGNYESIKRLRKSYELP